MSDNPIRKITSEEWQRQIKHLQNRVLILSNKHSIVKAQAKAAKDEYDIAVECLLQAIGEDDLPLFVQDEDDE